MTLTPEKLRKMIEKSGLKQLHIARLVGIDETRLSRMLRGRRPMDPVIADKIANVVSPLAA
jgi:transcriptional regulator with XRE-family HTH domain